MTDKLAAGRKGALFDRRRNAGAGQRGGKSTAAQTRQRAEDIDWDAVYERWRAMMNELYGKGGQR